MSEAERAPAHDPDLPLLKQIADGDKNALRLLYERHARRVLSYLIDQLGSDHALAEETLQDVMLAVWQGAGAFRAEASVKTWILGIARIKALNLRRRQRPTPSELPENLAVDETGPMARIELHDTQRSVQDAIRDLPPEHREILELIFYHDLSGAEAARLLGIASGTVKSRLHRAKVALRGLLNIKEMAS